MEGRDDHELHSHHDSCPCAVDVPTCLAFPGVFYFLFCFSGQYCITDDIAWMAWKVVNQ